MNNKGADQTEQMRRLICVFVVCTRLKQVFSWRDSFKLQDLLSFIISDSSQSLMLISAYQRCNTSLHWLETHHV